MPGSENSSKKDAPHYTYVLKSVSGNHLYVGCTKNIKRRLTGHNRQENFSTASFAPWIVVYYEAYLEREDAERREKYLKTSQGSRLLKRRLKAYFYKLRNS